MAALIKSLRRGVLASFTRARAALPASLNDAAFHLPTRVIDDTPALADALGWPCVDLGLNAVILPTVIERGADTDALSRLRARVAEQRPSSRAFAARLPRGRVLGRGCSAIAQPSAQHGVVLADVSPHFGEPMARHRALSSFLIAPPPRRLAGVGALIGAIGHDNFYHWLFDVLPRIGLLRSAGFGAVDHWIVADDRLTVARELLSRAGIEPSKVRCVGRGGHLECEELVVTSAPGRICEPTPRSVEFLRELFGSESAAINSGGASGRRIYVARRGRRKIVNEDELAPVLAHHGIEQTSMEGLSLSEQIAVFRGASLVVAPHGAALSHLVHAAKGATLVELHPPNYLNQAYFVLAGACGVRYLPVVGSPLRVGDSGRDASVADFRIEAAQLDRALREVEPHS